MKGYTAILLLTVSISIPQNLNADLVRMSLDPINVTISAGSSFSMKLNIYTDYTDYENMYPNFIGIDWGAYSAPEGYLFNYDRDLINLVDVSCVNSGSLAPSTFQKGEGEEADWLIRTVGGPSQFLTLNFEALQSGYTNLGIGAYFDFGVFVYDPEHANAGDGYLMFAGGYTSATEGAIRVAEPTTMLLLGIGLVGLASVRRKFNGKKAPG